jgi:D-hexose-6-phosphate mutarotase
MSGVQSWRSKYGGWPIHGTSQVRNWRIYDIDGDVDGVLLALFGRVHRNLRTRSSALEESW